MSRWVRVVAFAIGALLVWFALQLLLMLFAGVLLAIFLRTLAGWVAQLTGWSVGRALVLVVLSLVGMAVLAGVLYAPRLAQQSDQLAQTLPGAVADLTSWLGQYTWGKWLLEQLSSGAAGDNVATQAGTVARQLVNFGVAVVVILFSGLYFAAEPRPYIRGLIHLVPPEHRIRAAEALYAAGHVLRWWLVGQATAMVLVGVAMGFGLGLIGVQLAFLLGVLAGLFEFIPFVGPVIALGPALLLALTSGGTQQAAYVLALYTVIQTAEGYVLTPLLQRRAVSLPPVVTIASQVALSWAAGAIGLFVAVPLVAVIVVFVQMLYVQDRLGDDVAPQFETLARQDVAAAREGTLRGLLPEPAPAAG